MKRRGLLATAVLAPLAGCVRTPARAQAGTRSPDAMDFSDEPLLQWDFRTQARDPLRLEALEVLRIAGREHLMHARIGGGVECWVPCNGRFGEGLPLFFHRVLPLFLGADLRDIESLAAQCLQKNYKIVGLPLWNAVGHLEMLALEAIGQAAGRPVHALLGGARRREVSVYLSTRERATSPAQEIDEFLLPRVEATGARAVKIGIGGRMSRNRDAAPGRTPAIVARARRVLGDAIAIAVDANGSYDARVAIEVGRMLEAHGVWFYEEPCPFEEFELTRHVAAALTIPVAGGEQDGSLAKWRWIVANRAVDIAQPDLFYAGGFLRALRIARWAESRGLDVVPHAPRAHAGTAPLMHFVALLDRPGAHHEFAANAVFSASPYPYEPELRVRDGRIALPNGPGFGIRYDSGAIRRAAEVIEPSAVCGGSFDA